MKPQTPNPKPQTPNPRLKTRIPKPETRTPKPGTRNPKPETPPALPETPPFSNSPKIPLFNQELPNVAIAVRVFSTRGLSRLIQKSIFQEILGNLRNCCQKMTQMGKPLQERGRGNPRRAFRGCQDACTVWESTVVTSRSPPIPRPSARYHVHLIS